MRSVDRILVYAHENASDDGEIRKVVRLARDRQAEVVLVDVLSEDGSVPGGDLDAPARRAVLQQRMQHLHRLASELRRADVHVTVRVQVGGPRTAKIRAPAGALSASPLSIEIMAEELPFEMTPKAVAMAKQKVAEGPDGVLGLRLGIRGGGCSGYAYVFDFATKVRPKRDRVYDFDGLKVVVDDRSVKFLEGATLEWEEKLLGYGFKWNNPQATGGCGCGASFTT